MHPLRPIAVAFVAALAFAGPARADDLPTKQDPRLTPVFHADRVWNAVTTTVAGRTFVGFPGADRPGIELEEVFADGSRKPYPDDSWNRDGTGPDGRFVRVNSVRIGPDGALWVVDAGAPGIGKPAVPGAPRLIRIDLATNKIARIYKLDGVTKGMSYVDDVRFHGKTAYLTDAGDPALIVLDLGSGAARRVLEAQTSTTDSRPMKADGKVLFDAQHKHLLVHADQLEVSPDGRWLYFQPASGPMSRVATALLDDPAKAADLEKSVTAFADTPTTGGTPIDAAGTIYLSHTDHRSILTITPDGKISTLISDPRLIWSDAMWIDDHGKLWIPATQQNLTPGFDGGTMAVNYPVWIYTMDIGAKPSPIDHP